MNYYDNDNKEKGTDWLVAELRRLSRKIDEMEKVAPFVYRDVVPYVNFDLPEIDRIFYYKGNYYKNRAGLIPALIRDNIPHNKHTIRSWDIAFNSEKFASLEVNLEFVAPHYIDGQARKYITTRGDILNLGFGIEKFPKDKSFYDYVVNGRTITAQRALYVFKHFIDGDIPTHEAIFHRNGDIADCDIMNLGLKKEYMDDIDDSEYDTDLD